MNESKFSLVGFLRNLVSKKGNTANNAVHTNNNDEKEIDWEAVPVQ
jgi:hypothetical protein